MIAATSAAITGNSGIFAQPYMQNAFIAGTAVALLAGLVGYFVVLRGQVFAGDALSHVAYTGALAALAAGVDLRLGLFVATIGVGFALGLFGGRGAADDTVIGTTFAWILGLGVFFLSIYTTEASTGNSTANVSVLFGSILGISAQAAQTAAWIAIGLVIVLLVIARPLLYSSIDATGAASHGVPVRILGPFFLAIVGATAATASQLVGALLVFGLLAAPPAAAQRLTNKPWTGFWLAGALAVASVWIGLTLTYYVPSLPASFSIMTIATLEYAGATFGKWLHHRIQLLTHSDQLGRDALVAELGEHRGGQQHGSVVAREVVGQAGDTRTKNESGFVQPPRRVIRR